jgi:hypothetical protein
VKFRECSALLSIICALFSCSGCGNKDAAHSGPAVVTTVPIELTPQTVVLTRAAVQKDLAFASPDGSMLIFQEGSAILRSLQPGSVLLIESVAVRKIVNVVREDSLIFLRTKPAALTDVIRNGSVRWAVPIRFGPNSASRHVADPRMLLRDWFAGWASPLVVALAASAEGEEQEDGGWEAHSVAKKSGDRLNLTFDVKNSGKGTAISFVGEGYLADFETTGSFDIQESRVKEMAFQNKNLNGEVVFHWALAREKEAESIAFFEKKLPIKFTAPLVIGMIPFVLEVGEVLIIKPVIGAAGTSDGTFKIAYNGTQGFSIGKANSVMAEGALQGGNSIAEIHSAAVGVHGLVIAVAMPRIELKLGAESGFEVLKEYIPAGLADRVAEELQKKTLQYLIPHSIKKSLKSEASAFIQFTTTYAFVSSGSMSVVPCTKSVLTLTGKVGTDASFLGKELLSKEKDVFEKKTEKMVPPFKTCDIPM